jgi:hypothetical protein
MPRTFLFLHEVTVGGVAPLCCAGFKRWRNRSAAAWPLVRWQQGNGELTVESNENLKPTPTRKTMVHFQFVHLASFRKLIYSFLEAWRRFGIQPCRSIYFTVAPIVLSLGTLSLVHAQDIEPRAYSNAPIGVNFLIGGVAYTQGAVPFDGSLPVKNAQLKTSSAVLAYARTLDLWGASGKFDAIVPYSMLSGTAELLNQPVERNVGGFADPKFRVSVNFYGAPALTLKEFKNYQQDLIIGTSLQVSVPSSQYDDSRVVNIGTNRWSFKPEVGISQAIGAWTLELQTAATLFTTNKNFFGGNSRSQDPIYSTQGHAIYGFRSGVWASLDGTYYTGGRTTINGVRSNDLQQNWRLGGTLALPVDARNSVKLYVSSGISARTDNNYDLIGVAWQYRWGAGL